MSDRNVSVTQARESGGMSSSPTALRRAAIATFGLFLALAAVDGLLLTGSPSSTSGFEAVSFTIVVVLFPVVGLVIAARLPGNRIGWLLLAIGIAWALTLGSGWASYGAHGHALGTLPGAAAAGALGQGEWVWPVGLMGIYLLLLFPDGRLTGPRWRIVARLGAVAMVLAQLAIATSPGVLKDAGYPAAHNPLGIGGIPGVLRILPVTLMPISIVCAAVCLVRRFRRSRGVERQQLKWLVTAGSVIAFGYLLIFPLSVGVGGSPAWLNDLQNAFSFSFGLIPIAIGFAVLRQGLYGIDLIIRRTALYGGMLVLLGTFYAGAIWLVGASLRSLTDRSDTVAVTISTLLVVALFQPVRTRVQRTLDRRFYRSKYDAQAAVETLSRTLAQRVDLDTVEREVLDVVRRTLQPQQLGLWLRPDAVTMPERPTGTTERA